MPVVLPEPDDVMLDSAGGETPLWVCPNCEVGQRIEGFGWRKRDDVYPGQNVWHKQSWCKACRGET